MRRGNIEEGNMKDEGKTREPLMDDPEALRKGVAGLENNGEERKWAEKALRIANENTKKILEKAPIGVVVIGRDRKIRWINDTALKMAGVENADVMLGKNCGEYLCPAQQRECPILDNGQQVDNSERILRRKDGMEIPIIKTVTEINIGGEDVLLETFFDISERKEAEERLAESEGRLSDLVFNMSDWIWEVDINAVYTYCSTRVKSILGYREDEILGKTPFDFMPPDEAERVGAKFVEIVRDKRSFRDLENRLLTKDGRRVWMLTSGTPILADDGELLGYRGVDTDITERKKAEQQLKAANQQLDATNQHLRASEQQLKAANQQLDATNQQLMASEQEIRKKEAAAQEAREYAEDIIATVREPLVILDKDLRVISAGSSFYRMFKVSREEAEGNLLYHLGNSQWDIPALRVALEEVLQGGSAIEGYEVKHDFDIIGQKTMLLNARELRQESNKNKLILLAIEDITERKEAEERLAESEGRLSDLVFNMSDWIWEVDINAVYTYCSTRVKSILGYREDEILGKTPFDFMPPDEAERVGAKFVEIVRDKRSFRDLENRLLTKDGRRVWMLTSGTPILSDDGELLGYRGVDTDITERKKAEEEVRVSRERLKIINKILRHDLANDFVVIKSALHCYRDDSEPKMLDEIEKRVDKSLNTIGRLREQESFIESHSNLGEYDVREVVNSIAIDHPDVEIDIEGYGTVFADEALYSVFDNLINNAIKHGNSKKIDVSISNNEQFCEIRFKDHGVGIPDEIKDWIFEEGFTHGETGNTGLGLYIVKQTIEGYKGNITAEDNSPNGAIFTIKLRKAIT